MFNKEKKVEPTSKSGNDAKPIVSGSCPDICSKCGAEYDDILGIGCCGRCFYGHDR